MKLALLGGQPVRSAPFRDYNSIGREEEDAAVRVIRSGVLSAFYGSNSEKFYGGPNVQELEADWKAYFGMKYACTANSATSALCTAVGAIGVGPGDEVIVTPYSMSATATAILMFNGVPIFSDIEDRYFGLDPAKIKKKITDRTKAIMVTNLFGHGARLDEIKKIADDHDLFLIEDCAQSPGASYKGKLTGTYGDIGVFSLNCHKTIQSGEGGVLVSNDPDLAKKAQLIRNHAEAVIGSGMEVKSLVNMVGRNYRMTEIEAAIGIEQLKKLDSLNKKRQDLCGHLNEKLANMEGIIPPAIQEDSTHVFYVYPLKINRKRIRISTELFAKALLAEGIPFQKGYCKPIHLLPLYQKKTAYGDKGCPFTCPFYGKEVEYREGDCPVVENLNENELLMSGIITPPNTIMDMQDVVAAFEKIIHNQEGLLEHE